MTSTAITCPACGDLVEPSDDPSERVCTHLTCKSWEHVASYDHRQGRWVRLSETVTTETPDPLALACFYASKADGSFADGLSRIAAEIAALREIVRLVDEHLFHEMQHVPLTPGLADAYDRAIVRRGSDSGSTLAEKHQEHYRSCNCLGDSSECCIEACECHADSGREAQ